MIDIISFADELRDQKMKVLHLQGKTANSIGKAVKGIVSVYGAPENGNELTFFNRFKGIHCVSTAIGLRAAFQLRRQIGTWLFGHSYNFLSWS